MQRFSPFLALVALVALAACSGSSPMTTPAPGAMESDRMPGAMPGASDADPRVGLGAGLFDAEEAIWNLKMVSTTPPPEAFVGVTNSDLAFKGNYAFQGNYNGVIIWDLTDPANPVMVKDFVCPASQSDVSVYENLMFVSGEGLGGRLDCGTEGVREAVSPDRLRGIRIFDISDIRNPEYIANVQTCRGSHTHSVLKDPSDDENLYIYVSGSAGVRPEGELAGCSSGMPGEDPNTALFRIEVIQVPLANPQAAAIVSSPRIFEGLTEPEGHGMSPADLREIEQARAEGKFVAEIRGNSVVIPDQYVRQMLAGMVAQRGGSGEPTAADSTMLREQLPTIIAAQFGAGDEEEDAGPQPGPTQCHDITLYPEIGLAGGACEGYGLLLDISDPARPTRIQAVADSNFAYWHSATFNNDGSKVLFTDEWGGGGQPKCREDDPMEWGANAIFTLTNNRMDFASYYKLPAAQSSTENCVAHNGSLIPVPGRDIMVQSWYQGGISVFDWTDAANPIEIAYHDRGPIDADNFQMGGSWSVYWYNGMIVNSEIARGLDVFTLTPSEYLTQNEIDAANTVKLSYLNAQGQPKYTWPMSFSLAKAYADQAMRNGDITAAQMSQLTFGLNSAEDASGAQRTGILNQIIAQASASPAPKVQKMTEVLRALATM
ncbi:LVIVD repeat-containing protein [Rubricoccus marinus]|uniref:LVIVD repeat-containing protein n=1 Tax=Rubricoccus marinus TaxID=716817 RepID=A0A259TYP9_9BACT|nr:hypothetical protein [Rubricoccus marinus]OZC02708.1 hypothetical protein BSZ36_06800 [Rubricoccus marinus]